jgi:hypothetical protein
VDCLSRRQGRSRGGPTRRETRRVPLPPAGEVLKGASVACDPFATGYLVPTRNRSSLSNRRAGMRRLASPYVAVCSIDSRAAFWFAVATSVNSLRSIRSRPGPQHRGALHFRECATGQIGSDQCRPFVERKSTQHGFPEQAKWLRHDSQNNQANRLDPVPHFSDIRRG